MSVFYNAAKTGFLNGSLNWIGGSNKNIMLVGSGYSSISSATIADHATLAEILPYKVHAITGSYSDSALSGLSISGNNTADTSSALASSVTWSSLNVGTIQGAVIYQGTLGNGAAVPICYLDSGGFPISTNGADITITFSTNGIFTLSQSA